VIAFAFCAADFQSTSASFVHFVVHSLERSHSRRGTEPEQIAARGQRALPFCHGCGSACELRNGGAQAAHE
jgi:hypothetical protein